MRDEGSGTARRGSPGAFRHRHHKVPTQELIGGILDHQRQGPGGGIGSLLIIHCFQTPAAWRAAGSRGIPDNLKGKDLQWCREIPVNSALSKKRPFLQTSETLEIHYLS